jgi:hypothetical protein
MGVGVQRQAPADLTPGKRTGNLLEEGGWVLETVWTSVEYLASTKIRNSNRPVRSESLYRLL